VIYVDGRKLVCLYLEVKDHCKREVDKEKYIKKERKDKNKNILKDDKKKKVK